MNLRTAVIFVSFTCLLICATGKAQDKKHSQRKFEVARDWGKIVYSAPNLYCTVEKIPQNGLLSIPRLHNPIGKIYLGNDPSKSNLKIKIGMKDWQVVLPKDFDKSRKVIIEVRGTPQLVGKSKIQVTPKSNDASIVLHAHQATVHGKKLRYEPQPHKNTLGYWADAKDWAEWSFAMSKSGRYEIAILQGCGKGQGGSRIEVVVGDQKLKHTVVDTGHFQKFVTQKIGAVQLEKGKHRLKVRAITKAKNAVMDLRQITITFVSSK